MIQLYIFIRKPLREGHAMTDVQQRAGAKKFAAYWKNRWDEKQETQRFWIDLLRNVYATLC